MIDAIKEKDFVNVLINTGGWTGLRNSRVIVEILHNDKRIIVYLVDELYVVFNNVILPVSYNDFISNYVEGKSNLKAYAIAFVISVKRSKYFDVEVEEKIKLTSVKIDYLKNMEQSGLYFVRDGDLMMVDSVRIIENNVLVVYDGYEEEIIVK